MTTSNALKGRYSPGRIDGGRAFVEWELTDGRFSMSGQVWDRQGSDCVTAGQCVDEIAEAFPNDAKLQRMREIWDRWHLNDMKPGSPKQTAWLKAHDAEYRAALTAGKDGYQWTCEALAAAGLNPDKSYRYDGPGAANIRDEGAGYPYGHAWIKEELPPEVVAEIMAWSDAPGSEPEDVQPFEEFIKSRGLTAEVEETDSNPNWTDAHYGATHWKATLKLGKRRLTCHYSQGSAVQGMPTAGDVLRAIVSDAALVEDQSFEDFARNLGLSDDSIKAQRMFAECVKAAAKLRKFLGEADFQFALYGTEETNQGE